MNRSSGVSRRDQANCELAAAKVLLVDDDELVTTSLRSFLMFELNLEPTVFNDSSAALDFLEAQPFDMVISDFVMPGVNGIELLEAARQRRPEAPRVLLTGYADNRSAIRALNEARIYHYVEKPWDNQQMRQIVVSAVERSHLARRLMDQLSDAASSVEERESLRASLVRAFA
jgi:DNA-binding NtrC family response regulator